MIKSTFSPITFNNFYSSFFEYNVNLFQLIKNTLSKTEDLDILDIACGTGISTRALSKVFNKSHIIGIDNNQELINYANNAFVPMNVEYVLFDALQIEKIEKSFDIITAKSALHLINESYIFDDYLSLLKVGGTFYAIERTNTSVDSFPIFDDARKIWLQQYNFERKNECVNHYFNNKKFDLKTYKFGQKVKIEYSKYFDGLLNKEMSCLWEFEKKEIFNWLEMNIPKEDTIDVLEEYDIIAITKVI